MVRSFSGIQPTGDLHLGNYLGAVRRWVEDQHHQDAVFCVVDLHALTLPQDPGELRTRTLSLASLLVACGLDPEACTLFVQSHVAEHTRLAWLMECFASFGELSRMTQFKDKSERADFISAGLFTYPALQAADILLYDTDVVPVGDDVLVVPEHVIPPVGARIMDLQEPSNKMSKSLDSPQGTILVLDDPEAIQRKIKRAVTDTDDEVRFDPATKPGVSNLLSILGAATGRDPEELAEGYDRYGPLKADAAEAVVSVLRPVQERYAELVADPAATTALLHAGADKARAVAAATVARVHEAVGLLPPG